MGPRGKNNAFVPRGMNMPYMQQSPLGVPKPENALNRAEQLLKVGQQSVALQTLYDVITDSQNRRRQWNKSFEGVMLKFVELAVELKKTLMIKEALHKYRAMCSHVYSQSLETVVRYLIQISLVKLQAAHSSATVSSKVSEDLEDSSETPFALLLEAAGTEQTKERAERQSVVPWMRFIWEIYRIVLDILKGNSKLELCYHEMAEKAFTFCQSGKRVVEFRRLCDILRQHLNQLIKYPRNASNDVQLSNPDTVQRFLETRFAQLNTAVELELWQEAYRTCEDIHTLIGLSKKALKAQMMVNYYKRLVEIFHASENTLYHACSLYRLYVFLLKHHKGVSPDELKNIASKLLLAVFCIPVYDQHRALVADYFSQLDAAGWTNDGSRQARMAALLGYASSPLRETLVAEVQSRSVLDNCAEELRSLHTILETDVNALLLADRLEPILSFMEKEPSYQEYIKPLKKVAVFRLLQHLCLLYDSMDLDRLKKLGRFCSYNEIETITLEALKARVLQVRIDHRRHCILFESNLFDTEEMRSHLKLLSSRFLRCLEMISRKEGKLQAEYEQKHELLQKALQLYQQNSEKEHLHILARKGVIEQRKEEQEKRIAQAELEARTQASLEQQRKEEEERRKVQEDAKRRTVERLEREMKERDKAELSKLKKELTEQGAVDIEEEELNNAEYLMIKKKEAELKQRREIERRLQSHAKKLDYIDRALREEQWSLLKEKHKEDSEHFVKTAQETAEKIMQNARKRHEEDLKDKALYLSIEDERQQLTAQLRSHARQLFEEWRRTEEERQRKEREQEEAARATESLANTVNGTKEISQRNTPDSISTSKESLNRDETGVPEVLGIEKTEETKSSTNMPSSKPMTWSEKIKAKRMQQEKHRLESQQ
ncbi:hypothetical protein GpartN1_g3601.t1 [Galdieria partita]|uniref:PCI domain-containing protein n=1 Tax=Galdieria partita TaxID=83374 RepID=A0A9C7PWH2_9RHOD|nr:hypothetical protein GpartN1_g3601.t1 [Galdieria partita]